MVVARKALRLLFLSAMSAAYLNEKEVHVSKALQQKAGTSDACEAGWRARQLRTPGGRWASGALSAKPGSSSSSSSNPYEPSGEASARLKFAALVTQHEAAAAVRLARMLMASGYAACDFHFVCVDDGCYKELMGQGLPVVLASDSSRTLRYTNLEGAPRLFDRLLSAGFTFTNSVRASCSCRHACDGIARDARREAGKQAGVDKKAIPTVHVPSAAETRKCVVASERMAMVATLLRNGHAVCAIDLASVFLFQDPLLHVNPLPQALVAARDFALFVVRPAQGLTAQLFDRMLKEYQAGYHAADQHLFHRNVRAFLARDQLHVLDPTRYVRATHHARREAQGGGRSGGSRHNEPALRKRSGSDSGSSGSSDAAPQPLLVGAWDEAAQTPPRYSNGSVVDTDGSAEGQTLAAEAATSAAARATRAEQGVLALNATAAAALRPRLPARLERRRARLVALHITCVG
jgi:hypothetical protein